MSFNNIIARTNNIIKNNPYNFYKVKPYLNTLNDLNIEKYKSIFKKPLRYKNYSKIQIGETYINNKNNYSLELFLLKWNFHSMTKIHNHSYYGCCMKIIEGNLLEELYDKNLYIKKQNIYRKNNTSFINNEKGYHKIFNYHYTDSYSLHVYCERLNKHTEIKYFGV